MGYLYIFLGETSFPVFCLFLNWVVFVAVHSGSSSSGEQSTDTSSLSVALFSPLLTVPPIRSSLPVLPFCRLFLLLVCPHVSFSKSFIVLALQFRSLIHFEKIFVSRVR